MDTNFRELNIDNNNNSGTEIFRVFPLSFLFSVVLFFLTIYSRRHTRMCVNTNHVKNSNTTWSKETAQLFMPTDMKLIFFNLCNTFLTKKSQLLPSLYPVVWSASFCYLLGLHKRQQRVSHFGVGLKGMYISFE